jgi:hypothetical protein
MIGMMGSSAALTIIVPATTTMHVTSPTALKGSIANVQLDSEGNPEWIQSGIWVLRVRPGASDSDLPSAHFVARMAMVMTDGTAMHSHAIYDFTLTKAVTEGNKTTCSMGRPL